MSTLLNKFLEEAERASLALQVETGHPQNCIDAALLLEACDRAKQLGVRDYFGAYHGPEVADGPFRYDRRYPHHWLMSDGTGELPAGVIIDATANQFAGQPRVRVVHPWEHDAAHYLLDFRSMPPDFDGPSDDAMAYGFLGDPDVWWPTVHG